MSKSVFLLLILISTMSMGQQRYLDLKGKWKFALGDRNTWKDPDFDDGWWEEILVPGPWEEEGFHGYNGFGWYRMTFNGRDLPRNKQLILNLGYIDDCDETYINGQLVGFSGTMPPKFETAYRALRQYLIPPDVINFNGSNTIAVRVYDVTLDGGMLDGKPGIYGLNPDTPIQINLEGLWQFQRGTRMKESSWKEIMVPQPWEKQGFGIFDGFGWYKKTFYLPDELYGEDLVLILGKIDDFDITYLNGQRIGQTNDGRPFGSTSSWEKLRIYTIPTNILRRGTNTITIQVQDLGIDGGMYAGPVGITTRRLYDRFFKK